MSEQTARAPGDGVEGSGVAQRRGPLRVAYLTGRYPEISHAFIIGEVARAHLAAILRAPRAWMAAFAGGLRLGAAGLRGRALGVLWAIEAILLWHQCDRRGIRHVHVHINGTAPVVALLCARFGRAAGGGVQGYSMTVHGSNEFYDVARERLAEKVAAARFVVCVSDFTRS